MFLTSTPKEATVAQAMKTRSVQLPDHVVDALSQRLSGELIRPGDAQYDDARQVWNAAIDRFPALIVRPQDADDVVAGYGTVDDGLVVDLSAMKRLEIDREQGIATA